MTKNPDFESAYKAIVGDFPVSDSEWCHFRQVWQLLHDALLHDFWQKQPFEERRQDLDPIPLALDLLEKFERAQLPQNLTLDNYGEPYNPYFDLQWLCNLRDRAGEWRARREQLPPGPPLREDAQRLLWKIRNQQGSLTADYANAVFWSAHNVRVSRKDRPDALQGLILQVLNNRPKATEAEVLEALRKHERQGVIETITDEVIEWTDKDGSAQETQISALKFRISRVRKKLQLR